MYRLFPPFEKMGKKLHILKVISVSFLLLWRDTMLTLTSAYLNGL